MNPNHLFTKPPQSIDNILFLISQELKIRRLFKGLQKAGIEEFYFEPHLDKVILAEMGLDGGDDETIERYCRIIDKRSRKIKPDHESIMKQAIKVYMELAIEKGRPNNLLP